jgi:hypothetical protein
VGDHERANRDLLIAAGAAVASPASGLGGWLAQSLEDGSLAAAAKAGYDSLPRRGTDRIVELVWGAKSA